MLAVLIGLGTWQVYRLRWKEGVLAAIAAGESAPAVPLGADPPAYTKVSVTGRLRFDLAVRLGAEVRDTRAGSAMGSYEIVPLERDGAAALLVNLGWVPESGAAVDERPGLVTVEGYVRPGDVARWFSAPDDIAHRQFFTLDPAVIGQAVGERAVLPFVLVALGAERAGGFPAPAAHLPQPPNNHLSYVITWYGLAVALLAVFGVWVRKALRE
jgi:surfeit locus 1 family protein